MTGWDYLGLGLVMETLGWAIGRLLAFVIVSQGWAMGWNCLGLGLATMSQGLVTVLLRLDCQGLR